MTNTPASKGPSHGTERDLIARLEAATEGNRELDIVVWEYVGMPQLRPTAGLHPDDWVFKGVDRWVPTSRWGMGGSTGDRVCLRYTTDLDAAMTLVPEGWEVTVSIAGLGTSDIVFARVANDGLKHEPSFSRHGHGSPALTLCITALKARTPSREGHG